MNQNESRDIADPKLSELHIKYKSNKSKQLKTRMKKKTNHICGNSQMVASHLSRGHPQQSISMEEAVFHDIQTEFIGFWQWILVSSFGYCISRGNGKTQANWCIGYVTKTSLNSKFEVRKPGEIRQNSKVGKEKARSLVYWRKHPLFSWKGFEKLPC